MTAIEKIAAAVERTETALVRIGDEIDRAAALGPGTRFAACGFTALGVQAALLDLGLLDRPVFRSPEEYATASKGEPGYAGPLVGISMSGHSAEIGQILSLAAAEGAATAFVTRGSPLEGVSANLHLDLDEVAARLMPLAAYLFTRRWLGGALSDEPAAALIRQAPSPAVEELRNFLASAYRSSLVPVFTSSHECFLDGLLYAGYLEFLKAPAFRLAFPQWTHDFLWALGDGAGRRFAFVHVAPREDLADGRFSKVVDRLDRLGIAQLVLRDDSSWLPNCQHGGNLARALALYLDLSKDQGVDPEIERGFD